MFKMDGEKEPFAEEAKFFTEARLLQRDIQIVLEGTSNQNLLGTVLHPVSGMSLVNIIRCVHTLNILIYS